MKNGRCLTGWLAAGLLLGLAGSVWAQQMAPVNPAFARWQRERAAKEAEGKKGPETARPRAARAAAARGEAGGEDMDFGFVPTVLDMGYLSNLNDNLAQGVGDVLEPAYDLREAGALTVVRDQGAYGNCWAFAAMGSLESWVKKSEGTELDLSENHLVNLHGWSQGFGAGGNAQMAEGYFLRWAGPVAESEDAYPRPGKSVAGTPVRHVQRVRWIPGKTAYLDNDGIKQALKSWGALQADYYHAGSYYNAKTAAYYFNPGTSYRLSNHAVDLVGWDDGYSRKNFKPEPPGDGAYIVRNSWGSGWGEGGYFHISYYDESFAWKPLYSFSGTEAADNYDAVYQHDPLGMVGAIGYAGPTAWGANVFTAAEASKVAAAGFYAMTPRTTYTLMVYTGCRAGSPRSGTLAAQQSGTVDSAGYVTVPLETPAAVSAGQRFSVVVQLTTPGYAYPLAVEYAVAGYSAAASAKEGESYLSANGSKWDDFTARVASTANFCCKAYVKSAAVVRSLAGLSIEGVNSLKAGSSAVFSCTAAYSDGSSKAVSPRWSIVEGAKWASVDSAGQVTAKATGEQRTVKLRASYSEGGVTKTAEWSFFVTVAAPAAPADLEATAGTEESCVRLSWTASEGAAGYAVYRGTRESSGNAAYLGTVTATRYADTAAVPGVDYRYFVKAKNGSGSSPFSAGAWGWRALAAPANLSASDGTRDDRVDVAWNRSEGASHYRVWRADGEDGEPVAVSPWQTACQYADTTAEAGMPHLYYATAAVDAEGTRESAFGVPDEGFRTGPPVLKTLEISGPVSLVSGGRGTYTCTAVSTDGTRTTVAPEWTLSGGSLAVSDGKAVVTAPVAGENTTVTLSAAYSDGTANRTGRLTITVTPAVPSAPAALELVSATERGIALRWSAVANATSYQLWRSGPAEESAVVASTTATEHTDASAVPGVAYAYRVGAANAAGAGAPGGTVVEAVRPVAAPTGVSASYGTYADKVAVSWKACEGAEFYRVWRADSADGAKTALGAWQTALAFDDTTATAGTVHYYTVQAAVDETGTAASAFGGPAVGLRKISPKPVALTILGPDRVAAESTAAYTAKVRYENGAVASVVPVWSIASGGTFATIGSDGLLTVGKLEEDRTIVVTARFIDGSTVEGSLEVALVAPIVKTASVKDVEAHARWPWNGWVDVDYTLETAPTGTVAKVTLSGYDRDHKAALVASTLAGDGARGATVEPGKRRLSWNLGADYPDFHASRVSVTLNAVPSEPVEPGSITPADLPEGLVAYWPFDGDARDASGNGYDLGVAKGLAARLSWTTDRSGNESGAAVFNNDVYLEPHTWFEIDTNMTISAWVKPAIALGGSHTEGRIGAIGKFGTNYFLYPAHGGLTSAKRTGMGVAVGTNGVVVIEHADGYDPATLVWSGDIGSGWTLVTVTLADNGAPVLYVNGKYVKTGTATSRSKFLGVSIFSDAVSSQIAGGRDGAFKGCLDDFAIWNRALTAEEVAQLYGGEEPENPDSPVITGDVYVSADSGNDSNDGRSWATAKKSIQAAIDASSEGETILVADGTYAPIVTANKAITIRSVNGAGSALISGNGTSQCALLGGEVGDQSTVLDGFTVSDGYLYITWEGEGGAGVRFGTIRNCIIRDCRVNGSWSGYGGEGGGVWGARLEHCQIRNCSALAGGGLARGYAFECIFEDNYSRDDGGALFWSHAENCLLSGNYAYNTGGRSAGAAMYASTNVNCTIVGNQARSGGIVGRSLLNNCIVYDNICDSGELVCDSSDGGTPTAMTSCYTNDPGFVDAANGDYRLASGSPCIDAGDNAYVTTATDLAGNARIANGTVDIGCYEYGSSPVVSLLADGLVAYWPFDGDARDASGNGNDGTVNGATPTSDRNGKANGAYHFDGNDSITVANSTSLRSPTKAISLAAWMKPDTLSGWVCLLCKGEDKRQYGFAFSNNRNFMINDECGETDFDVICRQSPGLKVGVWKHIVVTWDGKTVKGYADGMLVGENEAEGAFIENAIDLYIGKDPAGSVEYYKGDMDDLAIWNRALTADEVARLYAGEKPTEHGLTARYYEQTSELTHEEWASHVSSFAGCKAFYKDLMPSLVTTTLDIGDTLDFGRTDTDQSTFHGKYNQSETDYFSMTLAGSIVLPETGEYEFTVSHDDGCIIFVDGQAVYSHADDCSSSYYVIGEDQYLSSTANLTAGCHDIFIAYNEYAGVQALRFRLRIPSESSSRAFPQGILFSR